MSLATARESIATALSTVPGVSVATRPLLRPRVGDGWVIVSRIVPSTFSACSVTFTAVIILGQDEKLAETRIEEFGIPLVDAVTGSDLNPADVSLEGEALPSGDNASPLYALALTLTLEV